MKEITLKTTITTKELADKLHTSSKVILENAKKCLPDKVIENGKATYWSEPEVTILIDCLQGNSNNHASDLYFESKGAISTTLTPALKIKKAMELMQEGYEEELAHLRSINAEQSDQIAELTPQAQGYLEYVDRGRFCNFRDAANYMHITQNEFMDLLRSKYIYKNSVGEYRCYAQYNELFALRPFTKGDQTGQQLMLTIAGLNHFGRVLGEMHKERQQEIWQSAHEAAETLLKGMKPCFGTCAI